MYSQVVSRPIGVLGFALAALLFPACIDDPSLLEVEATSESEALSQQWVRCAKNGGYCAFSGTRQVRYGQNRYTIRTFTGGVACNAATFGAKRHPAARCDVDMSSGAAGSGGAGASGGPSAGAAGSVSAGASGGPSAGAAGSVTAGASGGPSAGAAGSVTPVQLTWPGANGKSGVNGDPILNRASVDAFCTWRGRPCTIAHTYTDRTSWESMVRGSGWAFDNFAGYPGQLVISQGLVPNGRAADMAACASGTHDQDFRDFGALMVRKGRGASIVRLGWEFNATFMPWAATNTTQWKQCFQRAATAIRATNPSVLIDWTINAHGTPSNACGGSSINCYPGDSYVDIIGIDNYDHAPSASTLADFNRIADAPDGLTWIYKFAKLHGKPISVGEWGVAPGSDYNQTGENPEFIRWMHQWFAAHAADLAYESYFNSCIPNDVESNLYRPAGSSCVRQNVRAGGVYQSLFGR